MVQSTETRETQATEGALLDNILAQAREMWQVWRVQHPDYLAEGDRIPIEEIRAREVADVEECQRIVDLIVPRDRDSLLALAADERVWSIRTDGEFDTVSEVVVGAVELLTYLAEDAIDQGEESPEVAPPKRLLDSIVEESVALWREWRQVRPFEKTGNIEDDDREKQVEILKRLMPKDKPSLLALITDDRVWAEPAMFGQDTFEELASMIVQDHIYDATLGAENGESIYGAFGPRRRS